MTEMSFYGFILLAIAAFAVLVWGTHHELKTGGDFSGVSELDSCDGGGGLSGRDLTGGGDCDYLPG